MILMKKAKFVCWGRVPIFRIDLSIYTCTLYTFLVCPFLLPKSFWVHFIFTLSCTFKKSQERGFNHKYVSAVPPLLHLTQHTALLKIAMRAGTDPGVEVGGASLFAARSLGVSLRPPRGPGRNPNLCARMLLDFRGFVGLAFQTSLPRSHFYYISVIINGVILIKCSHSGYKQKLQCVVFHVWTCDD
jgi:hypothetical protein